LEKRIAHREWLNKKSVHGKTNYTPLSAIAQNEVKGNSSHGRILVYGSNKT